MNYFNFNEHPVKKFVFYNDNGILYTSNRGWFDYDKTEKLDIGEITIRRKENFERKENFAIAETSDYFLKRKEYVIYVYVDGVNVKFTQEKPYTTPMGDSQIWTEQKNIIEMGGVTFTERKVLKTEPSNFGKKVKEVLADLESENIKIDSYTLSKLLKKYNLNKIIEK